MRARMRACTHALARAHACTHAQALGALEQALSALLKEESARVFAEDTVYFFKNQVIDK